MTIYYTLYMDKSLRDSVTFVMTSCNQFDLLCLTLQSFLNHNTYPIKQYIFIEDTEKIRLLEKIIKKFPEVYKKALLLYNNPKLGQIKSIIEPIIKLKLIIFFIVKKIGNFTEKVLWKIH